MAVKKYILFFFGAFLIIVTVIFLPKFCKPVRKQSVYGSGFELVSCEQITEQDVYKLCLRIKNKDPEEFEVIMMTNKFHGHVGPNNIYGAKMGLYAKELLEGNNHEIRVLSETGIKRPISCLNDGIMVAVGSTVGWGRDLLQVPEISEGKLAATFYYKEKSVRLEVKPEVLDISQGIIKDSFEKHGGLTDEYFNDVRKMGIKVWEEYSKENLFIVTYPTQDGYYCDFNEINVNDYYNRLHNYIHTGPTSEEVLKFIEADECVSQGEVKKKDSLLEFSAKWNSNEETVIYRHELIY